MDHELIIPQLGRAGEVVRRRRRCVDITIRIALVSLVLLAITSLTMLIYMGFEKLPNEYLYIFVAVLILSIALTPYLLKLEYDRRQDTRRVISSLNRTRHWAAIGLRTLMDSQVRIPDPQDDHILAENESTNQTPGADRRAYDSPFNADSEESRHFRATDATLTMLAECLIRSDSEPTFMTRHRESMSGESRAVGSLRRSLNALPTMPDGARSRERARRSRRVSGGEVSRPDLETLDVQRLPDPTQRWYLPRREAQIPEATAELSIRHPVQRPGLPAWPWQETPVAEDVQRLERMRRRQSRPTDLTTVRPLQAVGDFASPVLSELGRPVGQSRRVASDDVGRLIARRLLREDPQIPGAVYEQGEESNDPVQGQDLTQQGLTQGPRPLASQREPDSHLPVLSLGERPTQGPCPLVSQRQHGPSQISPCRPSHGQGSETTRRQQEPPQGSENPTEETLF